MISGSRLPSEVFAVVGVLVGKVFGVAEPEGGGETNCVNVAGEEEEECVWYVCWT